MPRVGQTASGEFKHLAGLCPPGIVIFSGPVKVGHPFCSENCLCASQWNLNNQMISVSMKQRMLLDFDKAVAITGRAPSILASPSPVNRTRIPSSRRGESRHPSEPWSLSFRAHGNRTWIDNPRTRSTASRTGCLHTEDASRLHDLPAPAAMGATLWLAAGRLPFPLHVEQTRFRLKRISRVAPWATSSNEMVTSTGISSPFRTRLLPCPRHRRSLQTAHHQTFRRRPRRCPR